MSYFPLPLYLGAFLTNESLPTIYVGILLVLLSAVAIFVFQQLFKTRRQETRLDKLQKQLQKNPGKAQEYYELGSLYLDKQLYVQSVQVFQRALKLAEKEEIEIENIALIYNALGFSYFKQEQYDIAIRHYKEAIKNYPNYAIAINNLGNVYEKKKLVTQAIEAYEQTLTHEPDNKTAKQRIESLRKRIATT